MHPAFSVVFLTTLIGAAQGLFLALVSVQFHVGMNGLPAPDATGFYAVGSLVALALAAAGLLASFFHLGHPERAWRAAAQWRTSWLSREVIVLPAFMAAVFFYGMAHWRGLPTLLPALAGVLLAFGLFVATGMIYACLRFLREWHTPLTVINYTLLGCASGFTLATAFAAVSAPALVGFLGSWSLGLTAAALIGRAASLIRNAKLKPKSTLQTAIGVKHPKIQQQAQGFMGGSFNTREFFHGKTAETLSAIKWFFLLATFPIPLLLLGAGVQGSAALLALAFVVQYLGLMAERWFFFAQANHPQNLYYQSIA